MELSEWHRWWKRRGRDGLNALLSERWNPIGVAGLPDDEYSRYAGTVGRMLREGSSDSEIARYLGEVRTDPAALWLEPDPATDRAVADEAVRWYLAEMDQGSQESAG